MTIKCYLNVVDNLRNLNSNNNNTNTNLNPFTGSQVKNLYSIPTVVKKDSTTRKASIAIIIAYHSPTVQSDLDKFWQNNFGNTSKAPSIKIYTFPGATQDSGWGMEESLDVQMVALANPNADIWVVEAVSPSGRDLLDAINYATNTLNVDIISCSWGGPDSSSLISENALFVNPQNPKFYKCFLASSGDSNDVSWPSVLSNVLSIGGTTLLPINNNIRNETTWFSAGSGYSTSVATPAYQKSVNKSRNRSIPDLSLIANPNTGVRIVYKGLSYIVGGTSVSCPLFAGCLTLANQMRFNSSKNPLTTVYTQHPTSNAIPSNTPQTLVQNCLYNTIYTNQKLKLRCLLDITTGKDGIYSAGNDFDLATGLGSPNVNSVCNLLATFIP